MLKIISLAESTYYDRKKLTRLPSGCVSSRPKGRSCPGYSFTTSGSMVCDEQIKEWLLELVEGEEHVYGYKLLAQCLRNQQGLILNKKKAYRLCKELEILQKQRPKGNKHPRRLSRNHVVTGCNQLWQIDIKYGHVVGIERFFFVFSIIDVFDRVIVDHYRGSVCEAKHICQTLIRALTKRVKEGETMPIVRSDNGPQFVSKLFGDTCESLGIVHERIPPRTPNMNAYIESFHSLLERDLFSKAEFKSFEDAYAELDRYMDFYNHRKMHGSLKRMPPVTFSEWAMKLNDRSDFHRAL
ncbi:IS3 family transposase [Paenibacillus sp. PL91]|uniref:IS3 family transposase n=1 Tax=Paenibacillus sp. PL91 TaxID=2729538 RepID=UPI0029500888|nr:IS3 family transposase [Paenibacillus sp. PL91]